MPLQTCERDGSQGWKWGEEGHCYTIEEVGSLEEAKKKAINQAIAIGENPGRIEAQEHSTFYDVPLLKAGTYYPGNMKGQAFSYTEDELDQIANDTNEAMPYLLESIEIGEYKGNEHVQNVKGIPAMVNILHQKHLKEILKTAMKDVTVEFQTQMIKGVKWLTGTLRNIPQEWAAFIEEKFPLRSVEILPPIKDPKTGKVWNKTVRGIGFLDLLTMPAVRDQPQKFAVEFSEEGETNVLTLFSDYENITEGGHTMPAKESKGKVDNTSTDKAEEVIIEKKDAPTPEVASELQAMKEKQDKLTALITEMQANIQAKDAQIEQLEGGLQKEQSVTKEQSVKLFCDRLVHEHSASEKAIELVKPFLQGEPGQVVEFAGSEKEYQTALEECFEQMIKEHEFLVVPTTTTANHQDPLQKPLSRVEVQEAHIAEFAEAAKPYVANPNDQNQVWLKAREMAINKYPSAF